MTDFPEIVSFADSMETRLQEIRTVNTRLHQQEQTCRAIDVHGILVKELLEKLTDTTLKLASLKELANATVGVKLAELKSFTNSYKNSEAVVATINNGLAIMYANGNGLQDLGVSMYILTYLRLKTYLQLYHNIELTASDPHVADMLHFNPSITFQTMLAEHQKCFDLLIVDQQQDSKPAPIKFTPAGIWKK